MSANFIPQKIVNMPTFRTPIIQSGDEARKLFAGLMVIPLLLAQLAAVAQVGILRRSDRMVVPDSHSVSIPACWTDTHQLHGRGQWKEVRLVE